MARLSGRTALVTGAGRGIGRGIAIRFAREGADVIVASRGTDAIDEVVSEINEQGGSVMGIGVDVGNKDSVQRMVHEVDDAFGPVDILVNCAQSWGAPKRHELAPPRRPVEDFREDEWDHTYQTGLKGTLYCMASVIPSMKQRGWGRIINFGSNAGQLGKPGFAAYGCTKEAIRALTRTAARELGQFGITVNCINPVVETEAQQTYREQMAAYDIQARLEQIPVGRLGDPEADAGGLAAFLSTDDASYLTGQTLMLDGGETLFA